MNEIAKVKLNTYNRYEDMKAEARDLRDKLKELQQIKIEQREAIKEQSLKRFISEDRVDVEI
jgi:CRISPR/Cas system CSM-associated protein Csm4 (group 5 of RAMP superfamily)|tara:strand:- start:11348 stop:11533 length:186 start_codon:yes stop_codon:yes gene_type:complete